LLVFTNDTQLAARLTDPETHVEKEYAVTLDAPVTAEEIRPLARGIPLAGRRTRPARVDLARSAAGAELRVTLTEGRNRQVRRMFQTLGRAVLRLERVRIGPLQLRGLGPGDARALRPEEVRALRRAVDTAPRR
jgi:pseudouridine synthase